MGEKVVAFCEFRKSSLPDTGSTVRGKLSRSWLAIRNFDFHCHHIIYKNHVALVKVFSVIKFLKLTEECAATE